MIAPWDPKLSLSEFRERLDAMENDLRFRHGRSEWIGFLVAVVFWLSGVLSGGLIVYVWMSL